MIFSTKNILIFISLFIPIVLPNALRVISVPIFVVMGLLALFFGFRNIGLRALSIYLLFSFVTSFYLVVGFIKTQGEAVPWVVVVYILSPLLWLAIWSNLLKIISMETVVGLLLVYGSLCCATVIMFYYIFLNYGSASLEWLIAEPNIRVEEGKAAATMHVYGSLVFITAAFFSSPNVIKNVWIRNYFLIFLALSALISGRSALLLAIFVGLMIGFISFGGSRLKKIFRFSGYMVLTLPVIIMFSEFVSNNVFSGLEVNILNIIGDFVSKVSAGGGEERGSQFESLLQGLKETWFLGAGHGVSVDVIRNEESPWKYELLGLSTLFHVGIFGFFIYLIPFIFIFSCYGRIGKLKIRNKYDVFVFSGFIAILVASMTNPYLESIDFQWMVLFPCVYFYKRASMFLFWDKSTLYVH